MSQAADNQNHITYIHFMIEQLQSMIRYIDSKHAVGMTLVATVLIASKEFIFPKAPGDETTIIVIRVAIFAAICTIFFGFMGIYPRLIPPAFVRGRGTASPNILYFEDICDSDMDTVAAAIDKTFPNSTLSREYRDSGLEEIYALSRIVMVKMRMFEFFMFGLLVFLAATLYVFLLTGAGG
jgi:hypothetical protein